jgi:hypothetical protein
MINQCCPVFMGIKPAALFPLRTGGEIRPCGLDGETAPCLDCLSSLLPRNISFFVLRTGADHLLIFLYEKNLLEKTLSCDAIRRLLSDFGYPVAIPAAFSIFRVLEYLKTRFMKNEFPHEVGLFLGYPPEDVAGFMQHKGQNYKLCGYWKVYGDVERAKMLFRQYDICRTCMERYAQYRLKPAENIWGDIRLVQ